MNNPNIVVVENTFGGFGLLQINVFLNNVNQPAGGAVVRVINPDNGQIIEEASTNDEGKIPPITLPTPPFEYSMQYNQPRPFNQYNLTVNLQGYQEAAIYNVQIYPSITAVQNVYLEPEFQPIYIPYPVLWGNFPPKIPEAMIKKLPFLNYFVVLPEPVVPSIIVVHAGVPNDATAPNYTVGFKDYIKNVASSEIYSTWPKESLKANILAILSFTLNRVYSEWYRGKGYNFTITNSTAYDQSFTFGRNIFREISDIVDELFTTYITKSDIAQPLFTQYCDGIEVLREGWLSQWGSKDLADNGYTSLQILKNYYGYDIILKEAKKVEGIPLSFQGVLEIGSTGEAVRTIQSQLNAISNNFPLIPKLVEDGIYGNKTSESVKVFQQVFDLPVTGIVNFPTWYKISDIYVAISRIA